MCAVHPDVRCAEWWPCMALSAKELRVVARSWAESNNLSYSSVPEHGRGGERLILAIEPAERARLRALIVKGRQR